MRLRYIGYILSVILLTACGSNDKNGYNGEGDPVVTLRGQSPMAVIQDDTYMESGATAVDSIDGTLPVTISGAVDTTQVGTYLLTYSAKDKDGHTGSTVRIVLVTAPVKLKKTEQIKSYQTDGSEVSNDSVRDDGFYNSGLANSYTRDNATDTVLDTVTNLMWQDNEAVADGSFTWLSEQDTVTCSDDNSSDACTHLAEDNLIKQCAEMTLGGHDDWRVPTIWELNTISINRVGFDSVDRAIFKHFDNTAIYWSITSDVRHPGNTWTMHSDGAIKSDAKDSTNRVRCVRNNITIDTDK